MRKTVIKSNDNDGVTNLEKGNCMQSTSKEEGRNQVMPEMEITSLRSVQAIEAAEEEFFHKVWYYRHQSLVVQGNYVCQGPLDPKVLKQAYEAASFVEQRYGKDNLGPYSDCEWGMICGKLSALRWVLGDEWDVLDS